MERNSRTRLFVTLGLGLGAIALCTHPLLAQDRRNPRREERRQERMERVENQVAKGTSLRGKIVRVDGPQNTFVILGSDGREYSLYSNPQTTFRLGVANASIETLKEGQSVSVIYDVRGDRNILYSVSTQDMQENNGSVNRSHYTDPGANGSHVRGRISRVLTNPNQLVMVTADGKEITINLDSQAEVMLPVEVRDGRTYLRTTGVMETERRAVVESEGTTIEGTVVRVQGRDNQFVLKTNDGQEIILYSAPNARIRIEDRVVPLTEVQVGTHATVIYDGKGDRKTFRSLIVGGKRRNR